MLFIQPSATQSFSLTTNGEPETETSNSLNASTIIKINKTLFPEIFSKLNLKNKSKTEKIFKSNLLTIQESTLLSGTSGRTEPNELRKSETNKNVEYFRLKLFSSKAMIEPNLAIESESISSNGQLKENIVFTFPKLEDTVKDMNLI